MPHTSQKLNRWGGDARTVRSSASIILASAAISSPGLTQIGGSIVVWDGSSVRCKPMARPKARATRRRTLRGAAVELIAAIRKYMRRFSLWKNQRGCTRLASAPVAGPELAGVYIPLEMRRIPGIRPP